MELEMELKTAIEILEYHQEWRLGKREDMIHEPKKLTQALDIVLNEVKKLEASVSGSLHLVDFIEEIEYMQGLYSNARYTQAEATRDKLAEQLDDLMRLGSNDR